MLSTVQHDSEAFSRDSTGVLRGLMAVAIYLSHVLPTCELQYLKLSTKILSSNAYLFVGTFFMLSGYGLFSSYRNKPQYLENFIGKRFIPLYIKNVILIFAYSIFTMVYKNTWGATDSTFFVAHGYVRDLWMVYSSHAYAVFTVFHGVLLEGAI